MPEIGTSGSMSGEEKRAMGPQPYSTALLLDSTFTHGVQGWSPWSRKQADTAANGLTPALYCLE